MAPLYGIGDESWWFGYVLLVYAVELAFIKAQFKTSVLRAAYVSFIANAFTAVLGLMFCCFWTGVLGDSNPLFEGIKMLTIGAIVSAVFEAGVWQMILAPKQKGFALNEFIRPSLVVHGIGVLLGVVMLLAQPQPFVGVAAAQNSSKRTQFIALIRKSLDLYIEKYDAFPPGQEKADWFSAFASIHKGSVEEPELIKYDRFGRPSPVEMGFRFNPEVAGKPFKAMAQRREWVVSWEFPSPRRLFAQRDAYSRFGTR
jgi:hypothetical protein